MTRTNAPNTPRPGADRPEADWPIQARLRLEHAGRWVAWTEDGQQVVAAADDFEAVREAASRAGVARAIVEWLPPLDQARTAGGA